MDPYQMAYLRTWSISVEKCICESWILHSGPKKQLQVLAHNSTYRRNNPINH